MDPDQDLESTMNDLIQEHGLVSVLDAFRQWAEYRANATKDAPSEHHDAFQKVAATLNTLISTLPTEIDIEIALEHLFNPDPDLDAEEEKLASGLE